MLRIITRLDAVTQRALKVTQAALAILALGSGAALAQSMTAEGGTTAAAGNTVSMTRIPVRNSAGVVTFKDIQIQFAVSSTGVVTLAAGFPTVTNSPAAIASNFKAGTYKHLPTGARYVVTGPAIIPSGRVMWHIVQNFPVGQVVDISWATGAVAGHPFQAQLNRHKITSSLYTWGIVGAISVFNPFVLNFDEAVGAQQIGNQLVFHLYNNPTSNAETGAVTLTLCPTPTTCP